MDPSALAPVARPSAPRMIDLPAPVSPVSAVSPGPKARSRLSMSTISRMARPISMVARMAENPPPSKAVGFDGRTQALGGQQPVGVAIPQVAGIVEAEHGAVLRRLGGEAQGQIGLHQPI